MPIPSGVSRNVFHGHLPGGEVFGWSLWVSEAPLGAAAAQTQADAISAAFLTVAAAAVESPALLLHNDAGYDGVTVYSYTDTSGHASAVAESGMTLTGTNTGAILPNQCAVVVSLLTNSAGRRAKGRFYLPMTGHALGAGGQLGASEAGYISQWAADLVHAINDAVSPGDVSVVSQVGGTIIPVTKTRVDTRVDIQRRRANRQGIAAAVTTTVP